MILTYDLKVNKEILDNFVNDLLKKGVNVSIMPQKEIGIMYLSGDIKAINDKEFFSSLSFISSITITNDPYLLVSRSYHPQNTIVSVGDVKIGDGNVVIFAGPCSVENEEQIMDISINIKKAGANILRAGAFKPRTSPYSFQGLGLEGLKLLKKASKATGLPIVSEIMSESQIDLLDEYVDMFQVGARNMQNFNLLKALGKTTKPILLKRGMGSTIEEWLLSAEYILANGNPNVVLCERGIKTFETETRNTMDLSVISIIKEKTHLPIIIDPSHAIGKWQYVETIALAGMVAKCDGIMIEVHNRPTYALSDGEQSLKLDRFASFMDKAKKLGDFINRPIK